MTGGRGRMIVTGGVLLVAFAVLLVHLANVMLVQHESWLVRSCRNRWAFRDVPVQRGAILDRNGAVLASDRPGWSLWLDPPRFLRGHPLGLSCSLLATLGEPIPSDPVEILNAALTLEMARLDAPALPSERGKRARDLAQGLLRVLVPRGLPGSDTLALQAAFKSARRSPRKLLDVVPQALQVPTGARFESQLARLTEVRAAIAAQGGGDPVALVVTTAQLDEARQQAQVRIAKRIAFDLVLDLMRERESWPGLVCLPTVERKRALPGHDSLLSLETVLGRAQPFASGDEGDEPDQDRAVLATNRTFANLPDFDATEEPDDPDALTDFAGNQARSALLAYYRRSGRFGGTGVEAACDEVLAGTPGLRWIEKNARAEERRLFASFDVAPGKDVRLTIDVRLQEVVEAVLATVELTPHGECGFTLIDAESGEILALAGRPLVDAEGRPWWANQALAWSGPGDLGSVAKPFVQLEHFDSLRNGRPCLDPASFVPCKMYWAPRKTGDRQLRCDKVHGELGLDPVEALAHSCNFWFFQAGCGLGEEGVTHAFRRAGLLPDAEHPEVEQRAIPGMRQGVGLPARVQNRAMLENRSIGYGLEVGSLRVARAYAGLATGELPALTLVLGVRGQKFPLTYAPEDFEIVRAGLRKCVLPGGTGSSATLLAHLGGRAKTGTAEISKKKENNAWLAGYLPGAGGRTLAFAAVIYRVKDGVHGGEAAAGIVDAVLTRIDADPELRAAWLPDRGGR